MSKERYFLDHFYVFLQCYLLVSFSIVGTILLSGTVSSNPSIINTPAGNLLPAAGTEVTGAGGIQYAFNGQQWVGSNGINYASYAEIPSGSVATTQTATAGGEGLTDKGMRLFDGTSFGGGATGALVQGLAWGVVLYIGVKMLGEMFGADKATTDALSKAAFAGALGGGIVKASIIKGGVAANGEIASGFFKTWSPGQVGFASGVAIAVIIFLVMYKDTKTKVVNYQCLPWEPMLGGANCGECNKNSFQPCSEYRCKSLGQACELVNPGTSEEKCIWKSKNDVTSPTITPWEDALRPTGLRYVPLETRPNARGTRIVSANGDCLDAFTPLEFGITNNEPAQCKVDFRNGNLSTMQFFFGGSNYFVTNHTQKMKLPSGNADGLTLQNDGTFDLYVKCQDANGNVNEDVYVIEYCVKKGPDTTPPVIVDTSITSGSPVRFGANAVPLEVYTQEPAQCKWSRTSKPYDDMENRFTCATAPTQLNGDLSYTCAGNMTGVLDRAENQFYIRCQDYANNTMAQSYPFVLKGSQPLTILETSPNGTLYGATTTVPVTLGVKTDAGAEAGKASCYYSAPATLGEPIKFFATESFTHSQQVDVTAGFHQYSVLCIDAGGNTANRTVNFTMIIDQLAPRVTRVYREEALKVVTNEAAECTYSLTSCTFELDDGIKMQYTRPDVQNQHFVDWKSSLTYYVKCVDKYGNQPDPGECSVVVSPKQFVNATTV